MADHFRSPRTIQELVQAWKQMKEVEVTSGRSRAHALGALGDSEASLQNEVLPAQVQRETKPQSTDFLFGTKESD